MKNIAMITGASSGIGEEYFRQLSAKEPFDEIWVIARGKEKLCFNKSKRKKCLLF